MTIEEFLVDLAAAAEHYGRFAGEAEDGTLVLLLGEMGAVRLPVPGQVKNERYSACPIIAVASHRLGFLSGPNDSAWDAAEHMLGLSDDDAREIILAADDTPASTSPMRLKLLEACGLTNAEA